MHPGMKRPRSAAPRQVYLAPAAQADREPLETYEQALWRLVYILCKRGLRMPESGPLPDAAQIVADIYWVNDEKVRRDVLRYWGAI